MMKVLVPMADGFEDMEAVSIVDVLRRGGVEVTTASLGNGLEVLSAHGIGMRADVRLSDVASLSYDAIVLPGGGVGTDNLRKSEMLKSLLNRHKNEGRLLCAICAAPTVLVDFGLVEDNVQMTCYPTCTKGYERQWVRAPVVEDGNVITGQAPGSALLFALVVLKSLMGRQVSEQIANEMVSDVFMR